jgi:hypothetical protein
MNLIARSRLSPATTPRAAVAGLALASMLAIAGCGNDAGTSPSSPPSASATASAPSAPASAAPSGSGGQASPSSGLVIPHEDAALEARLPNEFNGKKLRKLSVGPLSSAGNVGAEPIKALAKEIGDGTGNFSLAYADDPTTPTFDYFALKIPGASTALLVQKYAALTVADTRGSEQEQVSLAGKDVTHVTQPGSPIGDVWFYAIDDTLFGVQAGSPEQATELLKLLP